MSAKMIKLFDTFADSLVVKDIEKLMKLFAEDAVYEIPQFKLNFLGKDKIRAFMESEFSRIEDYSCKKLFVCEEGENLAVEWSVHYRDNKSGKTYDDRGVTLIRARSGLILSLVEYIDTSRVIK
jgi:ketosteroid isomerase-like protein